MLKQKDSSVVFKSDEAQRLSSDVVYPYDLVVVEDALSAIRVGKFVPAVALLGTTVRDKEHTVLSHARVSEGRTNPRVAVWLDGDKAGRKGRENVARKLSLVGAEVSRINTDKDPKRYTDREIRRLLSD